RPFKHSEYEFLLKPRMIRMMLKCHRSCRDRNVYLLCAGAYVSKDMNIVGAYPDKMYSWGYFPSFFDYGENGPEKGKHDITKILWCGRYITWKRPMMAVELAKHLKKHGKEFSLTMIGNGELKGFVEREINAQGLSDNIKMLDSVPHEDMHCRFLESDIFFMTSDRNEGWGAVLNEAMNGGCICVADRMTGAAPWLIRDEENGFLYDDPQEAYKKIDGILEMDEYTVRRIQKNAYDTIRDGWTPRLAAERLKSFIEDPAGFVSPSGGVMRKL
ncbi:MAG: glycosyltransferase family 4 protein, partial [Lachnospiraceae bacterium]|nr:glycosyltransferase family 4 protein [Lachnospiraceae bacterium]